MQKIVLLSADGTVILEISVQEGTKLQIPAGFEVTTTEAASAEIASPTAQASETTAAAAPEHGAEQEKTDPPDNPGDDQEKDKDKVEA